MVKVCETQVFLTGERRPVLAFTDLHFSKDFGEQRLEKILEIFREVIRREKIEYVCFLGDLIDSLVVLEGAGLWQKLYEFLRNLGESLPVIMVLGNHDTSRYEGRKALLDRKGMEGLRSELEKILGVTVLGGEKEIFDDGKVRMLGIDLPNEDYHYANFRSEKTAEEAFREKMGESLPKLETEGVREKYILIHSSRFLREVKIPEDVVVLSGHMHDGVLPPALEKLMETSGRGLVGPGFSKKNGRTIHYEAFPWNARLRPRAGRLWLTLRPVNYLPRDRKIGMLNRIFPEISYTVIKGGAEEVKTEEKIYQV